MKVKAKVSSSNEQLQRLEKHFRELEQENPGVLKQRLLGWALAEDRYSVYTIRRAVNHLLSKDDYCGNRRCDCQCGKLFDKEHLLDNLYYLAYPPVYKAVWLSEEDLNRNPHDEI